MLKFLSSAALLAIACVLAPSHALATTLSGKIVHVRDADTIEIATSRGRIAVRLNGVDAPELSEWGGQAGKRWMQNAYGNALITCKFNGQKTYDRWVGVCWDKNGVDLGAAVIAAGHARGCPRYSGGKYRKFETPESRKHQQHNYCR